MEAVSRAGIEPKEVGHVVFGNIIHTDAQDHCLAWVAGVNSTALWRTDKGQLMM